MSSDSIYSDDWNSSLAGTQMNAWNLEDEITRISSKADDFLSGIWRADSCASETNSRKKAHFNQDSSDPFRQFQTPPPGRTSPTPLADLYSQSIYQAEVDSDSWQAPENFSYDEQTDEAEACTSTVKSVDCMPQDMFSFSNQESENAVEQPESKAEPETLNRSLTEAQINAAVKVIEPSAAEEPECDITPKLIVDAAKEESVRSSKRPLLSLSIGMSICGVGLVFGAQIMHNAAVVNPGKSLIIAGLIGLFASVVLQAVNWFGRRRTE